MSKELQSPTSGSNWSDSRVLINPLGPEWTEPTRWEQRYTRNAGIKECPGRCNREAGFGCEFTSSFRRAGATRPVALVDWVNPRRIVSRVVASAVDIRPCGLAREAPSGVFPVPIRDDMDVVGHRSALTTPAGHETPPRLTCLARQSPCGGTNRTNPKNPAHVERFQLRGRPACGMHQHRCELRRGF
jgi:hypothetical protein